MRISDDGELQVKGPNVFTGTTICREDRRGLHRGRLVAPATLALDDDGVLYDYRPQEGHHHHRRRQERVPDPMEEVIKCLRFVEHAVVVGDKRPFIGALVTLDPEGLAAWLPSVGLSADTPLDRACGYRRRS